MSAAGIRALLADAIVPTTASRDFDEAAGLRRLAAEAGQPGGVGELAQTRRARQGLGVVCRWILNGPDVAAQVRRLAQALAVQDPRPAHDLLALDRIDIEGALVFACLLCLTGHCESAQVWWELAAGAGLRAAAYCLHLHHAGRGELREAEHWLEQAEAPPEGDPSPPPVHGFFQLLARFTQYAGRHGGSAGEPAESLKGAVERLVPAAGCGIVSRPDEELADELLQLTAEESRASGRR
ncbi:hypothetical protein ABZY03_07485 [Streptomyces klenkii]|uniref:hypothetical protein n=1 Tax=Streptomyces klenkii TaxID=1420899 RepID=UPI0033AB3D00